MSLLQTVGGLWVKGVRTPQGNWAWRTAVSFSLEHRTEGGATVEGGDDEVVEI